MLTTDKLYEVSKKIKELEEQKLSVDNCIKLSALYSIISQHTETTSDVIVNELNDILPEYSKYKITKIKYQSGEISKEEVQTEMKKLCKELYEFLEVLYTCSDMKEERDCLLKTLTKAQELIEG